MDNGFVPPMSPDDFAALAAFAGPIYQESRVIESYTSSNPIPNVHDNYGSMNIKQGLEQAQRLAQASVARPQPLYVPPAVPLEQPDMVIGTASFTPYPQPLINESPSFKKSNQVYDDSNQMDLPFNTSEQQITNDLLREISKKITKLTNLLEKREGGDKLIPKLKPNVKTQV
jgi:hypothetical protein